jgi:hypothetical protein
MMNARELRAEQERNRPKKSTEKKDLNQTWEFECPQYSATKP